MLHLSPVVGKRVTSGVAEEEVGVGLVADPVVVKDACRLSFPGKAPPFGPLVSLLVLILGLRHVLDELLWQARPASLKAYPQLVQ